MNRMDSNIRKIIAPYCVEDGYIMQSRGLKLIGVQFHKYDGNDDSDERAAMCIHKSLYGKNVWLYFNKGFNIVGEGAERYVEVSEDAFKSSFLLYSEPLKSTISISAIIGQNGTGKSTIVDTIVRLLNNMSAAILGEGELFTSARHLHYIDNVYASLAVYIDNKIKIITCKGRKLVLSEYQTNLPELAEKYENQVEPVVEVYRFSKKYVILNGTESRNEILPQQETLKPLLRDWFYTLVSNYSLYAYNYRDYTYERTNDERLGKFRALRPHEDQEDDAYWLKGVFHKNDGYQTPVVIHPMRQDGYVNPERVNHLGKNNLISLCFEKRVVKNIEGDTEEIFPFRTINQTHHIVAFYFNHEENTQYKGFVAESLSWPFKLDAREWGKIIGRLEMPIKEFWSEVLRVGYERQNYNNNLQRAWDYLTYKTIKVLYTYNQYQSIWKKAIDNFNKNLFKSELMELLRDSSHRTLKLRRAAAFLRYHKEESFYMNKGEIVSVNDIYGWMMSKAGEQLYPDFEYHKLETDDLIPPSFINTALQLVDNEHLEEYFEAPLDCKYLIPFTGLSSGERQIAYTLGNIVYHIKNIASSMNDMNVNLEHAKTLKYNYVNIMLDEVELYFHPDLQRRFVSLLIDAINGLDISSNSGINITLITHSPFVLSDISHDNILCLARGSMPLMNDKTFAANIHDLFNNTFILPNTIGEYAQRELMDLISFYNKRKAEQINNNGWQVIPGEVPDCESRRLAKYNYLAEVIGDEYLGDEIKDMLDELDEWIQN